MNEMIILFESGQSKGQIVEVDSDITRTYWRFVVKVEDNKIFEGESYSTPKHWNNERVAKELIEWGIHELGEEIDYYGIFNLSDEDIPIIDSIHVLA
jgi:hypothetical protein